MSQSAGAPGEVFLDARGNGRAMRLTWHHEADLVVLSLWHDHVCGGTFRLAAADVNDFIDALVDGLRGAPGVSITRPDAQPAGMPPRQRPPEEPESFTDWAFGAPAAHRATAS